MNYRAMWAFQSIDPDERKALLKHAYDAGDECASGKLRDLFSELDHMPCTCRHPFARHNSWDDEGYRACDVEACTCKGFEVLR